MYCNHAYIFYVLLVIILFVSINLLLLQYHVSQMFSSEKHKLQFHNEYSPMNLAYPANNLTQQLVLSRSLRPRKYHFLQQKTKGEIAEPPIPSQMLEKYALNNRYFKNSIERSFTPNMNAAYLPYYPFFPSMLFRSIKICYLKFPPMLILYEETFLNTLEIEMV